MLIPGIRVIRFFRGPFAALKFRLARSSCPDKSRLIVNSPDRRLSRSVFALASLCAILIVYPLSYAPACSVLFALNRTFGDREEFPAMTTVESMILGFYQPFHRLFARSPKTFQRCYIAYFGFMTDNELSTEGW